jgi:hypothetical protein
MYHVHMPARDGVLRNFEAPNSYINFSVLYPHVLIEVSKTATVARTLMAYIFSFFSLMREFPDSKQM